MIQQKKNRLFLSAPFFMVRTPVLPIDEFFKMIEAENIADYLLSFYSENSLCQEAIAVASITLDEALQKIGEKEKKEKEQIISSLLKYVLRMATRSTPFGLFSFVSTGSWDKTTSIVFDQQNITKCARPDMEWLLKVTDRITDLPHIFDQLLFRSNPLLTLSGDRIILDYVRQKETSGKKQALSIRANVLTKTILNLTKTPITITQLEDKIVEKFPSLDREKFRGVIKKLLEQQILLTNLLPSLLAESIFKDFLIKLGDLLDNETEFSILNTIALDLSEYNASPLGEGKNLLHTIQEKMKTLASSFHYLQVDSVYTEPHVALSYHVAKELEEATESLWRLSFGNLATPPLKSYHSKFLDKYGNTRRIPLLKLLSDQELGLPEQYLDNYEFKKEISAKEKQWRRWFKREWHRCLVHKQQEIVLTEELLDKLLGPLIDEEKALLSFDIFCEVIAESAEEIDKGNFLLNISGNTWQAGNTFGRFIEALGKDTENALRELYLKEESLDGSHLFVESSYLPYSSRSANVSIQPNLRCLSVDLGSHANEKSIPIEEIYVGATHERLYFTHKNDEQEIIVVAGNVLNNTQAPIPIRFLRDISSTRYHLIESFFWPSFPDSIFLPRVRLKNTILSAAQWKVDLSLIGALATESTESIGKKFHAFAESWELPRYLFMVYLDHRILLDRQNATHLNEIVSQLKKNVEVSLTEKIGQEKGQWVKSQQGTHCSEFIVPFVKNELYHSPPNPLFIPSSQDVPLINRWRLPGSEWLFVKFYLPNESENRFLLQHLSKFVDYLLNKKIIDRWFFVRYHDHAPHIRVRFHGDKEKLLTKLLPALHEWSLLLLQEKIIHDVHYAGYEREIERYGGEQLIEYAEQFFCADANSALELLHAMENKKILLPDYAIGALSLIDLLKGFDLNLNEKIALLEYSVENKEDLKGFRELKKTLLGIGESLLNDTLTGSLHSAFEKRKEDQSLFSSKLLVLQEEKQLMNSFHGIQESILHMHCNRFLGNDLILEKKARLYAHHILISIKEKISSLKKGARSVIDRSLKNHTI